MNINGLIPVLKSLYNANRPGMVWGAPGIGKSASFRAVAKELAVELIGPAAVVLERHQVRDFLRSGGDMRNAFGVFDLRLSQMDPVEVGGLPREDESNGTMAKLPPNWFPHTQRDDLPDFGILLLEELPTAPLSVQTTAYQLTLDKTLDNFSMKEGWGVFAAGNRVTDGGAFTKMPNALANRLCHLDVESDLDSWVEWAINTNSIDHSLLAFLRFKPDMLNEYEEHVKQKRKGFAFATERAWEAVNDFLLNNGTVQNGVSQLNVDDATALAVMSGMIGNGAAVEYKGFRDVWYRMPDLDGIVMSPDTAPIPEDAATQFAVLTALANKADYGNIGNCLKYAERYKQQGRDELMMLFVRDMQRRQQLKQTAAINAGDRSYQNAVSNPAYSQWAVKNADLFK